MEFQLSREEKIRNVNSVIAMKESELFHSLLLGGFDPDTFDPETYEVPDDAVTGSIQQRIGSIVLELTRYRTYLESI
jgi:hypothetical protein